MKTPRIVLLNPTCMDVLANHRDWLDSLGIELVAALDRSAEGLRELKRTRVFPYVCDLNQQGRRI